jgi:hypothetical protein
MNLIDKAKSRMQQSRRFYRCPGCGQKVDNEQAEAVREHHAHVLNPPPSSRFMPVAPANTRRTRLRYLLSL